LHIIGYVLETVYCSKKLHYNYITIALQSHYDIYQNMTIVPAHCRC